MDEPTPTRRRLLGFGGAGILAALAGCSAEAPSAERQAKTTSTSSPERSPARSATPTSPYSRVYRETIDAVVLVQTDRGRGTGFVVDPALDTDSAAVADSRCVVTNAHVVDDAATADLRFSGGQWAAGDIVGTDSRSDLAVVELPASTRDREPLSFAEGEPTVGQEVVALGNPFDLDGTMTTGIVSGVDRSAPAPTGAQIPDAIQTDAAVNPGNSGGPLLSLDGDVVAVINSEIGENVGFGISAALAGRVVPGLIANGSYEHPFLGVTLAEMTPELAGTMGLTGPRGVLVTSVLEDGPSAGLLSGGSELRTVDGSRVRIGGDVVLSIGGETILTTEDLSSHLALETSPGEVVTLTVQRDGYVTTVDVTLGARPGT
ncbi:S1C family serine protease [Halobellus salinisoli]|uniref:S1C family serine protease n=1 Tax=Halobellus salinisoli TaxID=3108500 RepID=UPI00300938BE